MFLSPYDIAHHYFTADFIFGLIISCLESVFSVFLPSTERVYYVPNTRATFAVEELNMPFHLGADEIIIRSFYALYLA